MSIESVAIGARLLNRPVTFEVVNVRSGHEGRLVVLPTQIPAVLAAVDVAKREVYFHGLTTVEQTQRTIASSKKGNGADPPLPAGGAARGRPVASDSSRRLSGVGRKLPAGRPSKLEAAALSRLVRQTVSLIDGFSWLDEPTGWFHLRPVQSHGLPKAIDKVLAVAGTVTAAQLQTALGRNRRLWKEPPPEDVLLDFCRRMPGVRIEDDRIIADPPRDWKQSLTGVEAKLVAMLKAHGPVMERGVMEDLCVGSGMNRFSFHAFVSWSPVIAQFGHSIYGLLGAEVSKEQVQELLCQAAGQPREPSRLGPSRLDRRRPRLAELPALEGGQHLRRHYHSGGAARWSTAASSSSTPTAARSARWPRKTAAPGASRLPPQARRPNRRPHRADARSRKADGRGGVG